MFSQVELYNKSTNTPVHQLPPLPASQSQLLHPKVKAEEGFECFKQEENDERLQSFFQLLEERESVVRNIWNQINIDISKRRSGKVKTYFPVMRIKTIMKLDPNVGPVSGDAAAAISFIAELFVHELSSLAWVETGRRSTTVMSRMDIFMAVKSFDHFDFLADVLLLWKSLNSSGDGGKVDSKRRRKVKGKVPAFSLEAAKTIATCCLHSKLSLSEDHVACFYCGTIIRRF